MTQIGMSATVKNYLVLVNECDTIGVIAVTGGVLLWN